jgi:hypothetical protein
VLASRISAEDFAGYPPLARRFATEHLAVLRRLPVSFAAILLREVMSYDWKFPVERAQIERQLHFLGAMNESQLQGTMAGFAALPLSAAMEKEPWARAPAEFTEKLTAYLWTVHQMDRFREAAARYQQELTVAEPEPEPAIPRLCVVVVGRDAAPGTLRLFERLRAHGTYFTKVKPADGLESLIAAVNARAKAHPLAYSHWYVDGGEQHAGVRSTAAMEGLIPISYTALGTLRKALLAKMSSARTSGTVGPEDLRSMLAQLRPDQMGAAATSRDAVLQHFELSLLTEGAGTQIFSTTFVQWAARELLRRARPLTLLLRFAPRQMERPMNEMLFANVAEVHYDPAGSLIDADMGAYYTWINLMRLTGAEDSRFVAWFEDQQEAIAIAPTMAKKAVSTQVCTLSQILGWIA